jgi:ligand-binding sensor domain-containing protein
LSFAVSETNVFAGTYDYGVFLSTNSGEIWTAVNDGLPLYAHVSALAVTGTNLFAGTKGDVFLSTNSGTSWREENSGLPYSSVTSFAANGTNLFAGTHNGVFRYSDGSWIDANSGLTNMWVSTLAVSGTKLFAGTNSGVFVATESGTNWTAVNAGLTDTNVYALTVSDANLYAGTDGGVFRRPLAEMIASVGLSTNELPREFQLLQNYPNPFNPSTTIKFELPKISHVTLTVYDILGRQVSALVNDRMDAGVHEIKFDGSNLASGVYFYRLQAGDFVATKRLLLLK